MRMCDHILHEKCYYEYIEKKHKSRRFTNPCEFECMLCKGFSNFFFRVETGKRSMKFRDLVKEQLQKNEVVGGDKNKRQNVITRLAQIMEKNLGLEMKNYEMIDK